MNLEKSALTFGGMWLGVGIMFFIYKKAKKQSIAISNAY
jgi:putrescine importer